MGAFFRFRILFLVTALLLTGFSANAQLGFCTGNSGDAIFTETFDTGTTDGPALAPGTTTYNFTTATPSDGSYTVSSTTDYYDWHNASDHTPNDIDGKMLIVNASFTADQFFARNISGLCENTSYEFSSWLLNMARSSNGCPNNAAIPINVKFQIWDDTDTNLLAEGDTGNLYATASPTWLQYGLVFKTLPNQTAVILKMTNNGNGGCGNDLGIDDIVFKSCGDFISVTDLQNQSFLASCEDLGRVSTTLTANPDFSIYTTHSYQWQQSTDGSGWADIPGASNATYTTPLLTTTTFYRVKVAEDLANVSNSLCNVLSEVFDIHIVPVPEVPASLGDVMVCADALQPLRVTVPSGIEVNWYDAAIGGNLLLENSSSFTTDIGGTYYAEAGSALADCISVTRTAVSLTIYDLPVLLDENLLFCQGETIILSAENNSSYLWNTGETTQSINVVQEGIYSVRVTNTNGCSAIKTISATQIEQPEIAAISSDYDHIVVGLVADGNYEFALNDGAFQDSPILGPAKGGLYVVNVRGKNNCEVVRTEFLHFVVPKFFSPNGDGTNDSFAPEGIEFFTNYEISIFDRYGRLLRNSKNSDSSWNGTFNSISLPASDYWYLIQADSSLYRGHFALKR
ncbi:T9SS type B sorting domain-containing protein [Maribacter sp.]|nr:T9SS type B sorting domain-containing protein [Maribacter sp.]